MCFYVQKEAFEPHYSKTLLLKIPVGIDSKLKSNRQIILLDGDYKIDDELSLFTVSKTNKFYSPANKSLYDEKGKDTFRHEQNLIISEKQAVLIMDVDMLALLISCKKQRSTDHVFVLVVFICSIRLQGNQYQRDC